VNYIVPKIFGGVAAPSPLVGFIPMGYNIAVTTIALPSDFPLQVSLTSDRVLFTIPLGVFAPCIRYAQQTLDARPVTCDQ